MFLYKYKFFLPEIEIEIKKVKSYILYIYIYYILCNGDCQPKFNPVLTIPRNGGLGTLVVGLTVFTYITFLHGSLQCTIIYKIKLHFSLGQ